MSQSKVDRYKAEKAKRQEIMRRERIIRRLEYTGLAIVCAAMIGWFGFSVYQKIESSSSPKVETYELSTSALDEYMQNIARE